MNRTEFDNILVQLIRMSDEELEELRHETVKLQTLRTERTTSHPPCKHTNGNHFATCSHNVNRGAW